MGSLVVRDGEIIARGYNLRETAQDPTAHAELVAAVTNDVELLKKVLLYHVVPGTVTSDQASNDITLKTVEGTTLRVNVYSKPRQYVSLKLLDL